MWINNAQFVRTVLVLLAAPRRRPMCCRHCGLFFCVMWLFSAPPRPAGTEPPSVFLNLFVLQMKHCLKAWYAGLHPKMPEACGGDSALRLCFLVSAVFWRVGDISGRPPFLESGVPTRLTLLHLWFSLQVCVSVESDTAEVWVCLCQPGSSLTHSLARWNSFVMKLIAPQWTRGFPGSWEFNESDGWSADRISPSVDGGISPEITEIYWLISSMRSNFTASTLSFFPAPWCAELSQPAKQAFEWRGKQLSHLLFYFEPPSVSVQSAVTLVSLLRIRWSQNSQRRLRVAVLSRARPILTAQMNSHVVF